MISGTTSTILFLGVYVFVYVLMSLLPDCQPDSKYMSGACGDGERQKWQSTSAALPPRQFTRLHALRIHFHALPAASCSSPGNVVLTDMISVKTEFPGDRQAGFVYSTL